MVADLDVRLPIWARVCVLLAAVVHLGLGATMVAVPAAGLFRAVYGEVLVWQAIGILQTAIGLALVAAFVLPARNTGLIGVALGLDLAAALGLVLLAVAGATEWGESAPLLVLVVTAAALLALPLLALRRPQVLSQAELDPRAQSTTTLFGLQQTMQALAAPASVQLAMFPDLLANGEKVMAEFRLWRERALQKQDVLSPQQQEALTGLDECLHAMLGVAELWNADAVRAAPEWSKLRASARRALVAFAWSVDMPMNVVRRRRESTSSVDLRPPGDQPPSRGSGTWPTSQRQ